MTSNFVGFLRSSLARERPELNGRARRQFTTWLLNPSFNLILVFAFISGCSPVNVSESDSSETDTGKKQLINRPASFVGTWKWTGDAQESLVLHDDGRAESRGKIWHQNGTWDLRNDGSLELNLRIQFQVDELVNDTNGERNIELMDVESIPTERDFPWRKVN